MYSVWRGEGREGGGTIREKEDGRRGTKKEQEEEGEEERKTRRALKKEKSMHESRCNLIRGQVLLLLLPTTERRTTGLKLVVLELTWREWGDSHCPTCSRVLASLALFDRIYNAFSPRARGTLFRSLSLPHSPSLPLLFFLLFLFFFPCSPCYSPTVLSSKNLLLLPRLLHLFPRATRTLLPLLPRAYSQSTELTTIRTLITASINFHHRPGFRGLGHQPSVTLDYSWLGFYRSFKFYFMTRERRRRRIKERKKGIASRARVNIGDGFHGHG